VDNRRVVLAVKVVMATEGGRTSWPLPVKSEMERKKKINIKKKKIK
jgi:hypothetical protein